MAIDNPPSNPIETGATVVITHRVRAGRQPEYEAWLDEITPVSKAAPGHMDVQIIRPVAGLTSTNTVIIRFNTRENLEQWMTSNERNQLIAKVRPLLATDDDFFIRSGLDFWFAPDGAQANLPVKWKQCVVTWSAIFPLVLLAPLVVIPVVRSIGLPPNRYLDTLVSTGIVVAAMVYFVMPNYTRLVHKWLFR